MSDADQKLLIYFADEEHLVRRLGAAVVACWREFPESMRNRLIEQAKRVADEQDSDLFEDQFKRFIADIDASR